jgi:hypothetical protein
MRRRDFIKGIVTLPTAWSFAAPAQEAGKLPRIGFLGTVPRSIGSQWMSAFARRLTELGWIDGHNCDRNSLRGHE